MNKLYISQKPQVVGIEFLLYDVQDNRTLIGRFGVAVLFLLFLPHSAACSYSQTSISQHCKNIDITKSFYVLCSLKILCFRLIQLMPLIKRRQICSSSLQVRSYKIFKT